MNNRNRVTAALGLLWWVSCVCVSSEVRAEEIALVDAGVLVVSGVLVDAAVEPSAEDQREPVLALRVEAELVPADALRSELEAELGVGVADADRAPGIPLLEVRRLASGNVEVALSSRRVPRASRELVLASERGDERVETIALIAANLVRNEAASLLPDLRPVATTTVVSVPRQPEKPKLVDPCDVRGEAEFGLDFAPGVGASSTERGRNATRRVSLGFLGTLSGRLDGLGVSLGANIQRVSVCGAQITYGANVSVGPVKGLQFAIANYAQGRFVGAQLGAANVTVGDFKGLQGAVVSVTTGAFTGMQWGPGSYAGGDFAGLQGGTVVYTGGNFLGAQGGVAAVTVGNLKGLQGGVLSVAAGEVHGLQLGVVDYAGSLRGAQLGLVNVSAGEVRGAQVGLINYAEKSTASVGLLSIVRRGRTSFDVLAQADTGVLTAGITHGGKYVHNSYGAGARLGRDGQHAVVTAGLGVRVLSTSLLRVDIDLVGAQHITDHMKRSTTGTAGLRVPVTFMLWRGFGVLAAVGYNVMITNDDAERDPSAFGNTKIHEGSTRVLGSPSLTFGLRYELDHGV